MKKLLFSLSCLVSVILSACDPPELLGPFAAEVDIKARLSTHSRNVPLGDTITLHFSLDSSFRAANPTMSISSVDNSLVSFRFYGYDSIAQKEISMNDLTIRAAEGIDHPRSSGTFGFSPARPFNITLKFVPPRAGLYYIEAVPQAGALNINRDKRIVGVFVDFDNPSANIDLLRQIGLLSRLDSSSLSYYESLVNERKSLGFGFYCFRVK